MHAQLCSLFMKTNMVN